MHTPVSTVKDWKRLPREFVESPFLEILKIHVDGVLDDILWPFLWEVVQDLQRSLPTFTILCFHEGATAILDASSRISVVWLLYLLQYMSM